MKRLIENTPLPNPQEQADNMIIWLGGILEGLGAFAPLNYLELRAKVGAWHDANVQKLVEALVHQRLVGIETNPQWSAPGITLTFDGWTRLEELKKGKVTSRIAFMAMKFEDKQLDKVFQEYFKPAVKETGFELIRMDENPPAGVIDNRMRAEIRRARFLIADLTHSNPGAYWEAGFAEGLGRPVIYTCEKSWFNEKKTHFDTNHCHTVTWNENDLSNAAKSLKATIRATLPSESIPEGA